MQLPLRHRPQYKTEWMFEFICFPMQESTYTEVNKMVENNITTGVGYENMYTNVPITTVSFFTCGFKCIASPHFH